MKPFDLEKALAGEKVVTGSGLPVEQITYFINTNDPFPVVCVINGFVRVYTTDGKSSHNGVDKDLFMTPKKLSGFVNVYADGGVDGIHDKMECADEKASAVCGRRIYCIDLSQFEEWNEL